MICSNGIFLIFFDYLDVHRDFFIKTNSNLVPDEFFETARFTTSALGNPMLVDSEGKTYKKNYSKKDRTFWKCSKYGSLKCNARAITEAGNHVVKRRGRHTH